MIGRDPTGSRLHRVLRCPASAALPQVDDLEPKPAAARGTAIHRYLQRVSELHGRDGHDLETARAAALQEMAGSVAEDIFAYLEILDVEAMPTRLAAEVALAYDWSKRTARELGRGIERDYSGLLPTEIGLTIDALGVSVTDVYVGDYKMGRAVPEASGNGQLMIGALAATRAYDRDDAVIEIVTADDDGEPHRDRAEVGAFELEDFADQVEAGMVKLSEARMVVGRGGTPNVAAGAHCQYCPAFRACPAQTALVRAAMSGPPMRTGGIFPPGALDPSRLADTWRTLRHVRVALGALEGELLVLAARDPIDLGDGRVLGPVETARESVADADAVHSILLARYGRDAADAAMIRKSSKTAIRKVISKHKPAAAKLSTQAGDGELDRVLAAARGVGGLRTTRSVRVRVTTRDKLAPPIASAPGGGDLMVPDDQDEQDEFG